MAIDVYKECPTYENDLIALRQTNLEHAEELLKCYSDEKAVPFFNSDNCDGDDFHYITLDRMKKAISFWNFSYENRYFVRWTIYLKATGEKLGTIEMFHRIAEDEFNHFGVLRIDLQSKFEKQKYVDAILKIANENFYADFDVERIMTKAIPAAAERIASLKFNGYRSLDKKFMMIYDNYFVRDKM